MDTIATVILAAGIGTRMKSDTPKVLHKVCGTALLGHVLNAVESLGSSRTLVVVGHQHEKVSAYIKGRAEAVLQIPSHGTGHALLQTQNHLKTWDGSVLILCADAPLVKADTLSALIHLQQKSNADCAVLSFKLQNPEGYGRIVRCDKGNVKRIVEELNASLEEKRIQEVNSGVYCVKAEALFKALDEVVPDPVKNEIYLTDIVEKISNKGIVKVHISEDANQMIGVNSRKDLNRVTQIKKQEILDQLMAKGVTIVDSATTYIEENVEIGADTIIHPNTVIEKGVKIGAKCEIGPFARLRSGVALDNNVVVGNFVELVRSDIGKNSMIKHLSYVGDAHIHENVNIGAGTITANFDGNEKHQTVIEEGAQIGSGSLIVAPVNIGKKSKTGAGAVIPKNKHVDAGQTVVGVPAKPIESNK